GSEPQELAPSSPRQDGGDPPRGSPPSCCARVLRPLRAALPLGAAGGLFRLVGGIALTPQAREVGVVRGELGAAVALRLAVVLAGAAVLRRHPRDGDDAGGPDGEDPRA